MKVKVRVFDKAGLLVPVTVDKVVKSEAEWKAQLSPQSYYITRTAGTERAGCGTLLDNKKEGVYICICCGLPLFASRSKFHSGTGWPSFFETIAPENVVEHMDKSYGMLREEIVCARCEAHLGHVFDDGPEPTGRRYCLNSEAMQFVDQANLASHAEA